MLKHFGRACCVPKSYIINVFSFFTTAVCIYNFLCSVALICFESLTLTHSLRLHEPHLARYKYISSRRKCDVTTDRLGIADWPAGHAENQLIPVPGQSIGESLISTQPSRYETNWFHGDFNLPRLQSTLSLSPFLPETESLRLQPPIQHRSVEKENIHYT